MDLTFISIIILAALIFILSGMIGYLYWQQTGLMQTVHSLNLALTGHLAYIDLPPVEHEDVQEAVISEDDRVSVDESNEETIEHVESAPQEEGEVEPDIDDYQSKTIKQLQDVLLKKGVPFGKRDSKTSLIELLKATA